MSGSLLNLSELPSIPPEECFLCIEEPGAVPLKLFGSLWIISTNIFYLDCFNLNFASFEFSSLI